MTNKKDVLTILNGLTSQNDILWEMTNSYPNIFKCEFEGFVIYFYTAPTYHVSIIYGNLSSHSSINDKDLTSIIKTLYDTIMKQSLNQDSLLIYLMKNILKEKKT